MSVNWMKQITKVLEQFVPLRVPDMMYIMDAFIGYEEALWLSLCNRYRLDPNEIEIEPLPQMTVMSAKQRAIRMYARYQPQKLFDLETTMQLMAEDGVEKVMSLMRTKYGPEPTQDSLTAKERLLILYATYDALHEVGNLNVLLQQYEGMEETLVRRVTAELGPEPMVHEASNPQEPRQRLRRVFTRYDPATLGKVDVILNRYKGRELHLFATMQRRYGREPSERDIAGWLEERAMQQLESEQERRRTAAVIEARRDDEEKKRRLVSRAALKVRELLEQQVNAVMAERPLPDGVERSAAILRCRHHAAFGDMLSERVLLEVTSKVFSAYDRLLVPRTASLTHNRYGQLNESCEWLLFLDCCYCNQLPESSIPKLRTIVSLLELKLGTAFEEVWADGGVENFLAKIRQHSQLEWAAYLLMKYGPVTEAELCERNRLRAHYLYYNPGVQLAEVDALLKTFAKNHTNLYAALAQYYGPEPPALPVDVSRVRRIIERHVPDKLDKVDVIIEAHCQIGDIPEAVIQKICRSYGPEPSVADEKFMDFYEEEMEGRFRIFTQEMRLREIQGRRLLTSIDASVGGLIGLLGGAFHEADNPEERMAGFNAMLQQIISEETEKRIQILEGEQTYWRDILDCHTSVVDYWNEDQNIELSELLKRFFIENDQTMAIPGIRLQMEAERAELNEWLRERLKWRNKWADDDARIAALERKRREEKEMELLREEADRLAAAEQEQYRLLLEQPAQWQQDEAEHAELHKSILDQRYKVLTFTADVERARAEIRQTRQRAREEGYRESGNTRIESSRALHAGCVFHSPHFAFPDALSLSGVTTTSGAQYLDSSFFASNTAPLNGEPAGHDLSSTDADLPLLFSDMCSEYLTQLLQRYEPTRVSSVPKLLARYAGREQELLSALEQQYNVNHWRKFSLHDRLLVFYKRRAPDRIDEISTVLLKFSEREDLLWQYLVARYGSIPALQSEEMTAYITQRVVRYLALRAPHLLSRSQQIVRECEGDTEGVFRKLVAEFGPEDPSAEVDNLARRLRTFYKKRKMRRAINNADTLARRFLGREKLLNKLLWEKFGDTVESCEADVSDITPIAQQQQQQAFDPHAATLL